MIKIVCNLCGWSQEYGQPVAQTLAIADWGVERFLCPNCGQDKLSYICVAEITMSPNYQPSAFFVASPDDSQ